MKLGDYGFSFVQLPTSLCSNQGSPLKDWPAIRLAQSMVLPKVNGKTDTTSMAVTLDLGGESEIGCLHPRKKSEVASRLANATLYSSYSM